MSDLLQEHYEYQRDRANRCPRCGSSNLRREYEDLDDVDEVECLDCGAYIHGYIDQILDDRSPFIAPGESGSHDRSEDYQ